MYTPELFLTNILFLLLVYCAGATVCCLIYIVIFRRIKPLIKIFKSIGICAAAFITIIVAVFIIITTPLFFARNADGKILESEVVPQTLPHKVFDDPSDIELIAIARGEKIISALEMYHEKNGAYPKSLTKLVPDYISKIPEPGINRGYFFGKSQFYYHKYEDSDDFYLSFRYSNFSEYYYKFHEKCWHYANH